MKKFAFLLAIVAVFAMSASAFAVNEGDIATIVDPTSVTGMNNGEIAVDSDTAADYKTPLYYYGDAVPAAVKLGVKVTITTASGNAGDMVAYQATGAAGDPVKTTKSSDATEVDNIDIDLTDFAVAKSPYTIGVVANTETAFKEAARKTLAVNPVQVTFAVDKAAVNIKTSAKTADTTTVKFSGKYDATDIDDLTDLRVFVLDSTGKPDSAQEVNGTGTTIIGTGTADIVKATFTENNGELEICGGTNSAGEAGKSVTLGLVKVDSAGDGFKINQSKKTVVAGTVAGSTLAASDVLATVTITTVDYDVKPASTFIWDLEKSGDIVVSLDMLPSVFESVSLDVKSADSFLAVTSADGKMAETGVTSNDVTVKSCDIKATNDGIEVTIGEFALAKLAPEKGNVVKRADLKAIIKGDAGKTATLDITIVVPAEEGPTSQDVAPMSTTQAAAVAALVANSTDLGLTTATSHDANSLFVDNVVPSELSNDVRAYFEITQPVENAGDYVALNGRALTAAKKTGESVTFFKDFGDEKTPDRISLRGAMSDDVLDAAVLIVDGPVPAAVKDAWTGKDTKQGVVIRKVNGVNVVVIYDGSADNEVDDPIYALVNRGSSSSSCDLGFGLVAVAGLAALALRKRSK